jgi:galactokinase
MDLHNLRQQFLETFGSAGNEPALYFAPGRVNLIGEHTDYNGGFVLPCALQFGTYMMIRLTENDEIRLATTLFPHHLITSPPHHLNPSPGQWTNYPLGVIDQMQKLDIPLRGMDILYSGDIPVNAGLSSSASIEMVTAFALNDLLDGGLEKQELALLSQRAEKEFAGVSCGIMDQFAVGMGEKDFALFLNCHTLESKIIPIRLDGYRLVIANTCKERGLADSKYNERVAECQLAVSYLSQVVDISRLGELGFPQFFKLQQHIPDEVVRRRARHVISENQRVLNAVNCLLKNNIVEFGFLMNASHDSLRENYEVTGFELDTLVDAAREVPGVLGARMTGAGFGGCTVNLVAEGSVKEFLSKVGETYRAKTGLEAKFYIAEVSGGVRKIKEY